MDVTLGDVQTVMAQDENVRLKIEAVALKRGLTVALKELADLKENGTDEDTDTSPDDEVSRD